VQPEAILYDLDDTLLANPVATFVPAYIGALTEFMADSVDPKILSDSLLAAIRVMDADSDSDRSNAEVFFDAFLPPLGRTRGELEQLFSRFYREVFPSLRRVTGPVTGARSAVQWARGSDRRVVVATNPVFPQTAIHQRVEWANLEVGQFDLVTTLETSHSTKAHPAYYLEISRRLGIAADRCVMVGDNWRWDVVNPVRAGMVAWWIADPDEPRRDPDVPVLGQGPLTDFVAFARSTWGDE